MCELEGLEEDFSDNERIVRGYLSSSPRQSGALNAFRAAPTRQSTIKEQSERLQEEINRSEQEIDQVVQDLERTYEKCLKQLEKRPCKGQLPKEQSQQVKELERQRERVEDMPELQPPSGPPHFTDFKFKHIIVCCCQQLACHVFTIK